MKRGSKSSRDSRAEPPELCSFACPDSDFPPADTAGLCRTMSAVFCRRLRRLVDKNLPCHWRQEVGAKRTKR